jgi:uncharacterized protein (DUF1800 family)
MADLPVYRGKFGERQAERLLWRAGFGPKPGQARKLARLASRKGVKAAVRSITRPKGPAQLRGPEPLDEDGFPIAPFDAYGHDVLWWLDRMVRSTHSFEERMALVWHDWFATADVDSQQANIEQSNTFRNVGLTTFSQLLEAVTVDPAMLVWLSGIENRKRRPNENYARELMELFTLGVSDASGYPYSETDVREQARALTGWRADWVDDVGYTNFRFDPTRFDTGTKTIFGQTGAFGWQDSCRLCLEHPVHKTFFVEKLWSYFIPVPPKAKDRKALERKYVEGGYEIRPVVESILMHPKLYSGPAMVKPPAVYIAGLHRARRRGVSGDWSWISSVAGQRLFRPPNVAGWNDERWLDTSTFRGRWIAANEIAGADAVDSEKPYNARESSETALRKALRYWGDPAISAGTRKALLSFCDKVGRNAREDWEKSAFRALRQNALRMLIATSPDLQAS